MLTWLQTLALHSYQVDPEKTVSNRVPPTESKPNEPAQGDTNPNTQLNLTETPSDSNSESQIGGNSSISNNLS